MDRETALGCVDLLDTTLSDLRAAAVAYAEFVGGGAKPEVREMRIHLVRMCVSHATMALNRLSELFEQLGKIGSREADLARELLEPTVREIQRRGIPEFRHMVVAHARYGRAGATPATIKEAQAHASAAFDGGNPSDYFAWVWANDPKRHADNDSVAGAVARTRDTLIDRFGIEYADVVARNDPRAPAPARGAS